MIDRLLLEVEKPARYIGNEINMVKKEPEKVDIRFAFCFPDVYEVGMSHLGLQILYYFFNRRNDTYCERAFAPWHDMEELMRRFNIKLYSLETGSPLADFDFVGFTLQYEMSYTNIINMLDLAGIPIWSSERGEKEPVIIAGGPCAYNPEPLADIIDIFYIGEGEVSYDRLLDIYKQNKKDGGSREDFLIKALSVDGIYVPQFYDVSYNSDGTVRAITKNRAEAPDVVKKVIVTDMDNSFYPEKQLTPLLEAVQERAALEVFRGCIRGCRFCQAGYVYRPVREKSAESVLKKADSLLKSTGYDEISLLSLSTGDYTQFRGLSEKLIEKYSKDNINISLPSLRIDAFSLELMQKISGVRKSGLTFAPEAGTQRLRNVINKGITEEEILDGCKLAFNGGWNRVKLYFMTGLPTETTEDLVGITDLCNKIEAEYYSLPKDKRRGAPSIVVSAACFVPKPFTPFQWVGQNTAEQFKEKQSFIKHSLKSRHIRYNYHEPELSVLEGVLARGDRRTGALIVKAWELGAKFDSWNDLFKYDAWLKAFEMTGLSIDFYACRERSLNEVLPWEHISIGIDKKYFMKEMDRALKAEVTPNCRSGCSHCGAVGFGGGVCFEKKMQD